MHRDGSGQQRGEWHDVGKHSYGNGEHDFWRDMRKARLVIHFGRHRGLKRLLCRLVERGDRMTITDELRTGGIYKFPSNTRWYTVEELNEIADRIDAALAERYVEMPANVDGPPKDIDGEIWHYGDKAKSVLFPKTAPRTVCGFGVINGRHVLFYLSENCSGHTSELHRGWDYADKVCHYKQPTVEDVLRDFGKAWVEWEDGSPCDPIAKYAQKLRLAGGDAE